MLAYLVRHVGRGWGLSVPLGAVLGATQWPAPMSPYLWCVVLGGISCFTMGFGIGANDVANNFGTSVGSKAITLGKAVVIASIFELIGSVFLGASVTESVRDGVLNGEVFENQPDLLLYGNLVALISGTVWLISVSRLGMPVSTTHSMLGALLGVGLAMGKGAVNWIYIAEVVAGWLLSPLLACVVGIFYYTGVRHLLLRKPNPVEIGFRWLWLLLLILCFIFMCFFIFSNPVIVKSWVCDVNGTMEDPCHFHDWVYANVGIGFGIAIGAAVVLTVVLAPLCYWKARKNLSRYAEKARLFDDLAGNSLALEIRAAEKAARNEADDFDTDSHVSSSSSASSASPVQEVNHDSHEPQDSHDSSYSHGENLKPHNSSTIASTAAAVAGGTVVGEGERKRRANKEEQKSHARFFHKTYLTKKAKEQLPWNRDLHGEAFAECESAVEMHARGEMFDDRSEVFFGTLQIISACVSCIVHGSNDVANATAPFASVYGIYTAGSVDGDIAVPVWILFLGGAAIGVGLTLMGHHVIRKIGVELLKISPSRGFCIEMAMGTVMVIGSFIGLPLSTTHCQIGASIGVGLMEPPEDVLKAHLESGKPLPFICKPNLDGINWKLMRKIAITWVLTFVVCATLSAALFAFSVYGPTRNYDYYSMQY